MRLFSSSFHPESGSISTDGTKVSGKKELMEIKLDPEVVDPDDIETLEDLIISAVNEAFRMQDEDYQENMNKISGGMGLGGLPF